MQFAFNYKGIDGNFLELDWFHNSSLFVIEDAITESVLSSAVKAVISMVAFAVVSLLETVTVGSIGDHWALLKLQNLFIKPRKKAINKLSLGYFIYPDLHNLCVCCNSLQKNPKY